MRATIVGVTAANLRTYTAVAGVPAALVVLLHLALDWNGADGISGRRDLAFSHGVALAVVLAVVLISSRVALHIETGAGAPVADAVAVVGSVAVLANLAHVWRDGSDPLHRFGITVAHISALLLVAAVSNLVARREQRRRSNPAPSL
jgi:peptidoglycan/LPS O-acetylase OafA/YrhL